MRAITIHLQDEQLAALESMAQEEEMGMESLLQSIIKQHLAQLRQDNGAELRERALSIVGQFRSANHDISVRHDDYLARAFDSPNLFGHTPIMRPGSASAPPSPRAS